MRAMLENIKFPELFFGFVSPMGVNIDEVIPELEKYLQENDYHVVHIRVTDLFQVVAKQIPPDKPLKNEPLQERYETHISYGNQLRRHFDDQAILSSLVVSEISRTRENYYKKSETPQSSRYQKVAYIIRQFKNKDEVNFLRTIYGKSFFQISIYSRRSARVHNLAVKMASSNNDSDVNKYRSFAEKLISVDENEKDTYGQKVSKIFHDADYIINTDALNIDVKNQVDRFCELIFSSNSKSPTKIEYGMFFAKAAALRSLDLSRQVGAAIFTSSGEIVSLGSNEVPKALGGTYWEEEDGKFDARDYTIKKDPNVTRKKEIISELISIIKNSDEDNDKILEKEDVKNAQIMDILEFGRIVHAEMSAISDAARLGKACLKLPFFVLLTHATCAQSTLSHQESLKFIF
ncbi:dCMP deaminase [Roseibium polysiphoniae]|uniref:dCMP deaminase n=1 Tax=Roseibium polysiphoniae TaxID=2571221 RepID=UPI0032978F29